jgi:spoIIIJ-associated protein
MEITEVKKILESLLDSMGVRGRRIEVVAGDPHTFLNVITPESGMLIGVQGETLRTINYIVKKIVEHRLERREWQENHPFLIDVNSYHRKRIGGLREQARILAERARAFKSDVAMNPLNAYERMIVHAVFSDDPEIRTESAGTGKTRHIVFKYVSTENEDRITSGDKALFDSK